MASTRSVAVEDDDYDAPQTAIQASAGEARVSATSSTVSRSSIEPQQQQRLVPALPSRNSNAAPHAPVPVIPAPSPEATRLLRGFLKQSVGMQAVFLISPPPAVADAAPVHLLAAFLSLPQSVRAELFQAQPRNINNGGNVRAAITHLTKSLSPAEREYIASVAAAASRTGSSSARRPSEANAVPLFQLRQYIEQHCAIVATMRANFERELNAVVAASAASSAQISSRRRSAARSAPTSSSSVTSAAASSSAASLQPSFGVDEIRLFLLGPVPEVFAPRATDAFQFDDDHYPIDSAASVSHGSSPLDAVSSSSASSAPSAWPESASTSSSSSASRSDEYGALFQAETGVVDPHAARTHLPATTAAAAATTVGVRLATDLAAAAALRSLPPFMRGRNVGHTPLAAEVAAMMHAFGDVARPSPAAVLALADYVRAWMTPIAAQCTICANLTVCVDSV
jgi:hypothetical protein